MGNLLPSLFGRRLPCTTGNSIDGFWKRSGSGLVEKIGVRSRIVASVERSRNNSSPTRSVSISWPYDGTCIRRNQSWCYDSRPDPICTRRGQFAEPLPVLSETQLDNSSASDWIPRNRAPRPNSLTTVRSPVPRLAAPCQGLSEDWPRWALLRHPALWRPALPPE